jgi:hypothetical protein
MTEWITDRLPTAEDADADGDVQIMSRRDMHPTGGHYSEYECIVPGQPWWSSKAAARAAQPTPPPAPAPTRWVTTMAGVGLSFIAACNDGTIWAISNLGGKWLPIAPIPQPEASDA